MSAPLGEGDASATSLARLLAGAVATAPLSVGDGHLRLTAELGGALHDALGTGAGQWVLRRLLKEARTDVLAAERSVRAFQPGAVRKLMSDDLTLRETAYSRDELVIDGQQVMQAWEYPYMAAIADAVRCRGGDVLEIGFGMGILASLVQERGPKSHTIVECHPGVLERCAQWKSSHQSEGPIRIVAGRWEEVIEDLGQFDAITFDAYPLNEQEWSEHYVNDVAYAHHFFAAAAAHLRPGGVFSYYSHEIDSMSRGHQRALLEHFRSVSVSRVDGLRPPPDCHYWQAESMLVVSASH